MDTGRVNSGSLRLTSTRPGIKRGGAQTCTDGDYVPALFPPNQATPELRSDPHRRTWDLARNPEARPET